VYPIEFADLFVNSPIPIEFFLSEIFDEDLLLSTSEVCVKHIPKDSININFFILVLD
jgi:hypothetical protein